MTETNPLLDSGAPAHEDDLLSAPAPEQQLAPNHEDDLLQPSQNQDPVEAFANSIGKKFDPVDYYVQEDVQNGGTGFLRASAKKLANDDWGRFAGVQRVLNAFTLPQDAVGRGLTKVMQWTGSMPEEDAKRMLSQDHVSPSDFLNYFVPNPDSTGGKLIKGGIGLAADIILDPINFLSVWGKAAKGGEVLVKGKTIPLSKLSSGERIKVRAAQSLEKALSAEGVVEDVSRLDAGIPATQEILSTASGLEKDRAASAGFNADELLNDLKGKASQEQITNAILQARKDEGFIEQMKQGERGWAFGMGIPFTNLYHQFDLPFLNRISTMPFARAFDHAGNWLNDSWVGEKISKNANLNAFWRQIKSVQSYTGTATYDIDHSFTNGSYRQVRDDINRFHEKWSSVISSLPEEVQYAVRDQMELGAGPGAVERLDWIKSQSPEAASFLEESQAMNQRFIEAYQARPGIPFEELAPKGPNEASTYMRHRFTEDYMNHIQGMADQNAYTHSVLADSKKIDMSLKGRKFRGTVNEANFISLLKSSKYTMAQEEVARLGAATFGERAEAMQKLVEGGGIKMMIDDPVRLVSMRAEEMARAIKNHDLMEAAAQEAVVLNEARNIPPGYVKFDLNHFHNLVLEQSEGMIKGDSVYKGFIPQFFKEHQNIAVPEMVYDDLMHQLNSPSNTGTMHYLDKVFAMMNKVATNIFLTTVPYNARNIWTNGMTSMAAGTNPLRMVDAMGMINPYWSPLKTMEFFKPTGEAYQLTKEQVWERMVRRGIIGSGFSKSPAQADVARAVSDGWLARNQVGHKATKFYEAAMLWTPARALAQYADDVPKTALFLDRLKKGFTEESAAQSVYKYFYNYQDALKGFDVGRRYGGLFISYPVKTMERALSELKASELGNLAIPAKVNQVLQGAWVEDPHVREQLNQFVPHYYKWGMEPIHGPLLPGGKEVLLWPQWAYNAMTAFFDPAQNVHPLFQLLGGLIAGQDDRSREAVAQIDPEAPSEIQRWRDSQWENILKFVPPYLREGLAAFEINGGFDSHGSASTMFSERYAELPPEKEYNYDPETKSAAMTNAGANFDNNIQFAKYLEDSARGTGLVGTVYSWMFPKKIDLENMDDDKHDLYRLMQRGNFIKKHISDLSLGFASLNNMDREMLLRNGAINMQRKKHEDAFNKDALTRGVTLSADVLDDQAAMEKWATENEDAKAILALDKKQAFLQTYYGWYLGVNAEFPRANPWNKLFGIPDQDSGPPPEPPNYLELENMFKPPEDMPIPTDDPDVNAVLKKDEVEK